jgi:hypothetical protein
VAVLTAARRNRLSTSTFAIPSRRAYPLNDASHARNALARVSQFGSPAEKAKVRSAVHARFPSIGKKKGKLAAHVTKMKLAGKFGGQKGGY